MLLSFLAHLFCLFLGIEAEVGFVRPVDSSRSNKPRDIEPQVLDLVRSDTQLSTLASIIAKSGGGVINPDIEQRFNLFGSPQTFMLVAPTNEAFSRIPKSILDQLSIPLNYPLLLSLLRSHFIDKDAILLFVSPDKITNVTAISSESYPIAFSFRPEGSLINNTYYNVKLNRTLITAANGWIHTIDRVLDPYVSTFGISTRLNGTKTDIDTSPRQEEKTMTDLVSAEPQLSVWKDTITEVLPAIMKRLGDRRGAESAACRNPKPFAVLPVNSAFSLLPKDYLNTLRAPFNFALSSHLLAWGISVPTCASFEDILEKVRRDGEFKIFSHRADLNLTVTENGKGSGELMVNNARVVVANRCAGNGCIWMVERLVDPVYGMF